MYYHFVFILLVITMSCGGSKPIPTASADCNTEAKVLDYTGLDACRFLLQLSNGTQLLPIEISDPGFLFSEGQIVKISYTIQKDVVTACLTNSIPAIIRCIQQVKPGQKPGQEFAKKVCMDSDAPLSISWVKKMVQHNQVTEIKKGYEHDKAHYVLYGNVYTQLYNCFGDLICEYDKSDKANCKSLIAHLTDVTSVWSLK